MSIVLSAAIPAGAGTILLSGDSNIGNPLDGSSGTAVDPGNAVWFTNILGASNSVKIQNEHAVLSTSADAINDYYNSQAGVVSSLFAGAITGADLIGVDLFITMVPSNAYAASEITALATFLSGGGTLFFMGENGTFFDAENARINAALAALGSGMSLIDVALDAGFNPAIVLADPLNAGVTSFSYAFTSGVSGGTGLLATVGGTTFVAYEAAEAAVPEPSAMALLGLGLAGMLLRRRTQA